MMPRHKIVYKYSCKIYSVNSRDAQSIDLPENMSADEFEKIIARQNLFNVTKISLMRTKCVYDLRAKTHNDFVGKNTVLNIYVDDTVKTERDICNILERKYKSVFGVPNTNTNLPHVLTQVITYTKHGVVYGTSKEETWQENHAMVEKPNPKRDIIINRYGKQIWPRNTDATPKIIQNFFITRQKN